MIARAFGLVLALTTGSVAIGAEDGTMFRLGVRIDARPFVFVQQDGSYAGFLYDMCRAAVRSAGVEDSAIKLVPVTAANRFSLMDDPDRAPDLLCDPTTMTMERLARWDFTPIVFFANSTMLRRSRAVLIPATEAPDGCAVGTARNVVLVGWVEHTTSDETIADMAGPAAAPATSLSSGGSAVCAAPYARHEEGIRDICADDGKLSFYVGDADILSAQVEAVRGQGLPCRVDFEPRSSRPEPYALIVGSRLPGLHQRIAAGIYAFFASGGADRSFAANFGSRQKSAMLAMLFTLYRIPGGAPHASDN